MRGLRREEQGAKCKMMVRADPTIVRASLCAPLTHPSTYAPAPRRPRARTPELVVVEERVDGESAKGKRVTFLKIDSDAMDGNRNGWCFTRTPTGIELLTEVEIGSWVYRSAFAWKKPLLARDGISMDKAQKTGAKIAFAAPYTEVDICERTRIQTLSKGRKCRFLRLSAKNPVGGGSWLVDTNLSNGKALLILHETVEGADEAAERVVDEAESASKVRRRRQNKAIAQGAAGMERAVVRMRRHRTARNGGAGGAGAREGGSGEDDGDTVEIIVNGRGVCEGTVRTLEIPFDITAKELVEQHILAAFDQLDFPVEAVTIVCGGDEIEPDEPMEEYVLFGTPQIDAIFAGAGSAAGATRSKLGTLEDRFVVAPRRVGSFPDALQSDAATVARALALLLEEEEEEFDGIERAAADFMDLGGSVAVAPRLLASVHGTPRAVLAPAESTAFAVGVLRSDICVCVDTAGTRRAQTARVVLAGVKHKLGCAEGT